MVRNGIAIVLAWLAFASPAAAQDLLLQGVGTAPKGSGGGGYTGPGDVVGSAYNWVGLRAYSAAYATSLGNAIETCPAATPTVCTIVHVTATGGLNASDLSSNGCGSVTTCTVRTLYDQSGNGNNYSQATAANRCTFTPNGISSGKPSLNCVGGASTYSAATITSQMAPFSATEIVNVTTTPGGNDRVFDLGAATDCVCYGTGDNYEMYAGSAVVTSSVTSSHSTYYAVIGTTSAASTGNITVNGTTTSGSPGNTATGTTIYLTAQGGTANTSNFSEAGLWASQFSGGNITSMNSNMRTYWGI